MSNLSFEACSVSEAVERLSRRDPSLKWIDLNNHHHTDSELGELVDCLLVRPDIITDVYLAGNELTDETGIKLARYVAGSSTIESFVLSDNQFSDATYLALAAALRANSSLQYLVLHGNQAVDRTRIEAAFVEALRLNPDRPEESMWLLYSYSDDFSRLKGAIEQLCHPSLQQLLAASLLRPAAALIRSSWS